MTVRTQADVVFTALRITGDLEGAPDHVITQALDHARHLMFPAPPAMGVSPAEAQCSAEQLIRRLTSRPEQEKS